MMVRKTLFGLFALLLASTACAQTRDSKWYGLASIGVSNTSGDDVDAMCDGAPKCEKRDTAFKLLGGYKFAPEAAIELGYWNFGKASASGGPLRIDVEAVAVG